MGEDYLVILRERGSYRLRREGMEYPAVLSGRFQFGTLTPSDYPTVGDRVTAEQTGDGRCVITDLRERKTLFLRRSAGTDRTEQTVAANVDTVFICMSLNRDYNLRRLERYLSLVWESGAAPVVVLTKKDLCRDAPQKQAEAESAAMGAPVLLTSSLEEDGLQALEPWLVPGRTLALMGSSGVGKSTLINRLLGRELLSTGGLRNDDRGHHTTTHRQLLELPCGAYVIDTPGMRELGMWESGEGIASAFPELDALAEQCRFSDCSHNGEPGCAVQTALSTGEVSEERFRAWRKLLAENAFSADSRSYLERKEQWSRDIAIRNKKMKKKRS